jgi:DNA-binding response OmpR family regulator
MRRKNASAPEGPLRRPRKLVLIADDEPIIGATLVEILQEEGYDALCVSDGESAWFWTKFARPDIIVADIVMPRLNGIELGKKVTKEFPETTIILFSGHPGSRNILEKAIADGWKFDVLAKPIRPDVLLDRMKAAI